MQRQGFVLPLLIGGATTSPAHTSVKIDPQYLGPVVYVKDASRSVNVCQQLITAESRAAYQLKLKSEHAERREQHQGRKVKAPQFTIAQARANRYEGQWDQYQPPVPKKLGLQVFDDYPLDELIPYIDWMPFFNAWEFAGKFPDILTDPIIGEQVSDLYADARRMLRLIQSERWLTAKAVIGLFPANSVEDDVEIYSDESRSTVISRLHFLRQQKGKPDGQKHLCLADYIAPKSSGKRDYVGAFAVTAGIGIEPHVARFEKDHDDYSAIILKALADRLAEALAERMHAHVRREYWGYAAHEHFNNQQLIREEYQGIRPAPGYPSCPDHTEKATLWNLLKPEANAGMTITESFAMLPTAAVSGWYFSHPDAVYFPLGKIDLDQVQNYAARKQISLQEAERWLSPSLGYEPAAVTDASAA
jgi:5-methyltetrahydrofolate--homocysteine methyltransferase